MRGTDCGVRFIVATFCCHKCLSATGPPPQSLRAPPLRHLQAPAATGPATAATGPRAAAVRGLGRCSYRPPAPIDNTPLERCISHVFINEPKTFHTVPLQPPANAAIRRTVGPLQSLARRCIFSCVLLITTQVAASSERQRARCFFVWFCRSDVEVFIFVYFFRRPLSLSRLKYTRLQLVPFTGRCVMRLIMHAHHKPHSLL